MLLLGGGLITKNLSLKFLFIGVLFFVCTLCVFAQSTTSDVVSENSQSVTSAKEQESQMVISTEADVIQTQNTNTGWLFVRMILVLLVVVGCIYAVFYFRKKSR